MHEKPEREEYLDCTGRTRIFEVGLLSHGAFLHAVEVREGVPSGMRLVLPVKPGEVPPYGELRTRLRKRLAERSLVRDARGVLHLLQDSLRGQLAEGAAEEEGSPRVLVDDMELTWEELGRLLAPHVGFGLRLSVHDAGEE